MASRRSLWTQFLKKAPKTNQAPSPLASPMMPSPLLQPVWVLGIDSSLRGSGIAVIEFPPNKPISFHHSQTIRIPPKKSFSECLAIIFNALKTTLERYPISEIAIEQPIFVQNARTAQILGAARAACIIPGCLKNLPISEYPPLRVKQAVVGFGRASKDQVAHMVQNLLSLKSPLPFDESDAAAVALCHANRLKIWKS